MNTRQELSGTSSPPRASRRACRSGYGPILCTSLEFAWVPRRWNWDPNLCTLHDLLRDPWTSPRRIPLFHVDNGGHSPCTGRRSDWTRAPTIANAEKARAPAARTGVRCIIPLCYALRQSIVRAKLPRTPVPDAAISEADGFQRRGCLTGAGVMPSQRASPVCLYSRGSVFQSGRVIPFRS
jgi:hypothetical protein